MLCDELKYGVGQQFNMPKPTMSLKYGWLLLFATIITSCHIILVLLLLVNN